MIPMEIKNPLDNITPSLGPFSEALQTPINQLLALIWFLAIIGSVIALIIGVAGVGFARQNQMQGSAATVGANILVPLGTLLALASLAVIVGALL